MDRINNRFFVVRMYVVWTAHKNADIPLCYLTPPTNIAFYIKWSRKINTRVGKWPGKCRSCTMQVSPQLSLQFLFVNEWCLAFNIVNIYYNLEKINKKIK